MFLSALWFLFGCPSGSDCPAGSGCASDCDIEVCNGVDDDCDGEIDESPGEAATWYADADGDGYGSDAQQLRACSAPDGYIDVAGDCDDANATVHPGGDDACADGVDQDCDGAVDEGRTWPVDADLDGWGTEEARGAVERCEPVRGESAEVGDCDDDDDAVYPGAPEHCDDVDEDCDGVVDEEAVDGREFYADTDGDGYGDPAVSQMACVRPDGFVARARDCDDADVGVHPHADELCNGVDNDCDGHVDLPWCTGLVGVVPIDDATVGFVTREAGIGLGHAVASTNLPGAWFGTVAFTAPWDTGHGL